MKGHRPQVLPEIFSLELRRRLEEDKVRARRRAQAHSKRVGAALGRERKLREATAAIADAEFEAATMAAAAIERAEPEPKVHREAVPAGPTNGHRRARSVP